MINREWRTLQVLSYTDEPDEYGELKTDIPTIRDIQGIVKIYSQVNVDDIRYADITHIILTKDKELSVKNKISFDNEEHQIKYIIPSNRLIQVFVI